MVKEQINITTPFYNENFKYSHSILANISSTNGPFIIYTLGGVGDSYVIYENLVALPPLDDLNVEDPHIKY